MKNASLSIVLFLIIQVSLSAQQREKITKRSALPHASIKEVYQVLKADKSVKDGFYRYYRNDQLMAEGYYFNGSKDSVWKAFGYNRDNDKEIVVATRLYSHGKKIGKWEFFESHGWAEWSYDFTAAKAEYTNARAAADSTSFYYQSESGDWTRTPFDKKPIPLYGKTTWEQYLMHSLYYPQAAMDAGEQGTVLVAVLVDENGEAIDYSIYSSPAVSLNDVSLEMVKGFYHEFIPAEKNGKKVKFQYRVPITFRTEVRK